MNDAETMSTEGATENYELREEYAQFVGRKVLFIIASIAGIVVLAGVAATLGSANITPIEVYSAILARLFPDHFQTTDFVDTIVWQLRLHRVLMAIFAGMGLAVAGSAMQGILKNPLASPFTLGIASAATFGPLVTPTELAAGAEDVQPIVLDIRDNACHIVGTAT